MQSTRNERKASMVEYWLVVAVITVISVVALSAAGAGVSEEFMAASDSLDGKSQGARTSEKPEHVRRDTLLAPAAPERSAMHTR